MRILDLFSGIGGFALGMEMAGFPPPVAFCEIEPFCRQVLAKHWPEVPCHEDVTKLSADAVRPIDIICGGFPCQDISCAGKGLGIEHGERSGLWREMFRLIGELMPRWVLVENVPALRTRGADRVIADLETLGYTVWPLVVGAWAVGAPHKRDRAWIVAHRNGVRECEQKGCIGQQRRRAEDSSFSALAHAKRDRRKSRRAEERRTEGCATPGSSGRADMELAHPSSERREEPGREHAGEVPAATTSPWPAGRGEGQQAWEPPRVLRLELGLGRLPDGVSPRMVRRLNRDKLRAYGNAVVPQVVAAIARRILEIDAQSKP